VAAKPKDQSLADMAAASTLALFEACGGRLDGLPRVTAWLERIERTRGSAATGPA
jgi:glutathione S-transferase